MSRFQSAKDQWGGFYVKDNQAGKWNMPEKATTLSLREQAAIRIAQILNEEWLEFLRNPT